MCHAGQNRKSWLIFASGIEHAEHIAEQLGAFGIDCAPVHSKRPSEYNDAAIKAFKTNELRAIVNYGKLTTGLTILQLILSECSDQP
jgi:DNA repair protein RadD